jgi:hypothetical protein
MKTRLLPAAFAAALFCAVAGPHALAAGPKLSSAVAKPLVDAQKLLQSGDTQGALAKVKEAQAAGGDHTDYDNFMINAMLLECYAKLNDMADADTAAEAAADSPAIPDDQKQGIYHNALLLSAQQQHWQKAIGYGQQLTALGGTLDEPVTAALAIAYYQAGDMAHAQQYAQQDISMAKAAGQQPGQASLQIVMNAQVKQNNQSGAAQTLEQLAVSTGDPQAWGQLIDVSMSAQGMTNMYFLDLYRLRLLAGFMTQAEDYTQMGNAAYQAGYPTEAVKVFEQGIAAGKITAAKAGDLLRKSRNDAAADARDLPSIAKAAERSKSGEQDIKLAEDYWGYGRYAEAEAAARRAMSKGGLKVPAEGPLMLGMTLAAQGKADEAIAAFGQVNGTPAAMKTAHLWSLWVQSKNKPTAQPAAAQTPAQ